MEYKPRYPIYVPSKNRSDVCFTAKFFIEDGVDFKLVIEPAQVESYLKYFDEKYLLVLPENNKGLTYARLWIREHSTRAGFKRHWQFDDNIRWMYHFTKGMRIRCNSSIGISLMEDFTDRYTNIGISGSNYEMFVLPDTPKPYYLNCHVYSATLINNEMPFNWRLQYNHDVDICLQVVTGGWCTVSFNTFPVKKMRTDTVKGGNTDNHLESDVKRLNNAKILARTWPDYVRVVWKFNRWHFAIKDNWRCFKQPLIKRDDIDWNNIPKDFDFRLIKRKDIRSKELREFYEKNKI